MKNIVKYYRPNQSGKCFGCIKRRAKMSNELIKQKYKYLRLEKATHNWWQMDLFPITKSVRNV